MDCTIYLNDRKYRICDIGEGRCTLVLSYAEGIELLHEHFSHQFLEIERMIVIDISTCWSGEIDTLYEKDRCELITDIRLLTDIYWLDDFEIKTDTGQEIFLGCTSVSPI
ncbi:hypothetical protein VME0621_01289 [Vibrio mediterranei]|nr:hypothetical protein C9980_20860 [Vibrio mediterranei]SBO09196.1 hypothetical protein VME0621_01289 [Vibrio mediterranei]